MASCGSAARLLLRLCNALLLALGTAMCAVSATLYAQWRAQSASAPASVPATERGDPSDAPWFLYLLFAAGGALGCAHRRNALPRS